MIARVFARTLCLLSALFIALALIIYVTLGQSENQEPTRASQHIVSDYRITELERQVERMRQEHEHLVWLLIGNLALAVGALGAHLLKKKP